MRKKFIQRKWVTFQGATHLGSRVRSGKKAQSLFFINLPRLKKKMTKETAKISNFSVEDLQKSIQLQAISLRMQKDILENLEFIAKYHGIGYQPLIKQILKRFVDQKLMKF